MTEITYASFSEEETLHLGCVLGAFLVPEIAVLLSGDLGAGKTVLVRGIGEALEVKRVRSPSFTLINEYPTKFFPLVHVDLYRLASRDVEELGLEEYAEDGAVLLVEWAERWNSPRLGDVLKIEITSRGENERIFKISSFGEKTGSLLARLNRALKMTEKNGAHER